MSVLSGSDWEAVFEFTRGGAPQGEREHTHTCGNAGPGNVSACEGDSTCSVEPFGLADVAEVIATSEGENDGANWLCVVKLNDGRFAFVSAGCDYTGWDCQSSGHGIVATDLQHLVRLGLGDADRQRLSL